MARQPARPRRPLLRQRHVAAIAAVALAASTVLAALVVARDDASATNANSVTVPDATGDVGRYTSLELDAAGNPVVSYADITNGRLKLLHCNDPNCSGGDESIAVPDPSASSVGTHTSLALDAAGDPVISYHDGSGGDLKVVHCNDPNCSGDDEVVSTPDATAIVGRYTSIVLDADGYPVVSYLDTTNDDLKVLHCNDPNCSGGDESVTSPASVGDVGVHSSIQLDASGHPVISYYDVANADLLLLHCDDPDCAGVEAPVVVDAGLAAEGDRVGRYTSLALDSSGFPVISYFDSSNGNLKLARCDDPTCVAGGESIVTIDVDGDAGSYTSLKLDGNGFPVISYHDRENGDLKLARCNDPLCVGGDETIVIADSGFAKEGAPAGPAEPGTVGPYTSLALDAAGRPVVSYYDSSNGDLRLLHCATFDCAGVPPTPVPTPTSTEPPPPGLTGDVDCSGTTNAIDAALILQLTAALLDSLACQKNGDLTDDGVVNAIDATIVLQCVAGLFDCGA